MTTANKITLSRIFLIPVLMFTLYMSREGGSLWMWLSLILFVIASLTDYIDGQIARKCNQVSDFGKFLDPLADKLLTIAVLSVFCEWGWLPAWALMIVLTREFAVTGLRLVAVGKGTVIAAARSGKIKTAATMIGLSALIIFTENTLLFWLVTAVILLTTVYTGVEYFVKNWKCLWQ